MAIVEHTSTVAMTPLHPLSFPSEEAKTLLQPPRLRRKAGTVPVEASNSPSPPSSTLSPYTAGKLEMTSSYNLVLYHSLVTQQDGLVEEVRQSIERGPARFKRIIQNHQKLRGRFCVLLGGVPEIPVEQESGGKCPTEPTRRSLRVLEKANPKPANTPVQVPPSALVTKGKGKGKKATKEEQHNRPDENKHRPETSSSTTRVRQSNGKGKEKAVVVTREEIDSRNGEIQGGPESCSAPKPSLIIKLPRPRVPRTNRSNLTVPQDLAQGLLPVAKIPPPDVASSTRPIRR
ncbi:hypothetical protein JAAARDRAFT_194027 [Jaapia argillacea MUCL 33604]|uniref:Uncharacterized protein n=1 Tax=Jaapia argillacea MUCL 33604 TaxID=933084 RepID=A0A067PSE9_9AGAM|nr:hypothetical protein JAAARDRAFT_194027 [Jaapia argillacea MUCL 33604]